MAECTSGRESDGRNPDFLFAFDSNHNSISLSFRDIRVWNRDGRMSIVTKLVAAPHHSNGSANKLQIAADRKSILCSSTVRTLQSQLIHKGIQEARQTEKI